ncbi:MAG: hypothetical protein AB7U81_07825 [Thiohalomonadaceae bacterium]
MADPLLHALLLTVTGCVLAGLLLPDGALLTMPAILVWKAVHAPVYALLVVGVAVLLRREPDGLLASVLLVSLAGMAVEIAQPLVGRSAGFVDYLSNEVGVGLGAITVQWRRHAATRMEEESEG